MLEAGHQIRDGVFESLPANVIDTGETFDCVVVGGGISGLAAALMFQRKAGEGKTCLVIDNHPIFGGEAKRNEFLVDGHRLTAHQGSALFQIPYPHSFIARFYESIGLKPMQLEYQKWDSPEPEIRLGTHAISRLCAVRTVLRREIRPAARSVADRSWGKKLDGAPISEKARKSCCGINRRDSTTAQTPEYRGDALSRRLDTMTLEDYMIERHGISRETIRTFLSDEGGAFGLGPDALSAYTAYAFDALGRIRRRREPNVSRRQ